MIITRIMIEISPWGPRSCARGRSWRRTRSTWSSPPSFTCSPMSMFNVKSPPFFTQFSTLSDLIIGQSEKANSGLLWMVYGTWWRKDSLFEITRRSKDVGTLFHIIVVAFSWCICLWVGCFFACGAMQQISYYELKTAFTILVMFWCSKIDGTKLYLNTALKHMQELYT